MVKVTSRTVSDVEITMNADEAVKLYHLLGITCGYGLSALYEELQCALRNERIDIGESTNTVETRAGQIYVK